MNDNILKKLNEWFPEPNIRNFWVAYIEGKIPPDINELKKLPRSAFCAELLSFLKSHGRSAQWSGAFAEALIDKLGPWPSPEGDWDNVRQWMKSKPVIGKKPDFQHRLSLKQKEALARYGIHDLDFWTEQIALGDRWAFLHGLQIIARQHDKADIHALDQMQLHERDRHTFARSALDNFSGEGTVFVILHSVFRPWLLTFMREQRGNSLYTLMRRSLATVVTRNAQTVMMIKHLRKGGELIMAVDGREGRLETELQILQSPYAVAGGASWTIWKAARRAVWLFPHESKSGTGLELVASPLPISKNNEPFENYNRRFISAINDELDNCIVKHPFAFGMPAGMRKVLLG
tara:strand:+ start:2315 stop:3355 length:1041 start_codon:yes stop_codon:yes gene_type:complete